jgi:hypothetical protein
MNRKQIFRIAPLFLLIVAIIIGCNKSTTVESTSGTPSVNLAVSFSKIASNGLAKLSGLGAVDSIRIDSAVVVISRIKFETHIDTMVVDTTDGEKDDMDDEQNIVFRGPFVIHVRDTLAIDFANQVLPAGVYDGIKFKIHRLKNGEHHEDSDERNHGRITNDSSITGSSITVWGAVLKDSGWTNFVFNFNGELEFKIKGNFTVPLSTSSVKIALNFNMGDWFMNPYTGVLLDPTDTSTHNLRLIKKAIYVSFGKGKGGHSRGDGHPHD